MLRTLGNVATICLPGASTLKLLAVGAPLLLATASKADGLQVIHKWSDVQLYVKPKFNGISSWDQEFGIQATVLKKGNFAEQINFTYDPTYPVRWEKKPRFSFGFQSTYYFTKLPWKFGVYTKPKASPLPYTWKEETGLTWRLYTSKHLIVSSSAAYVFTIPFSNGAKPQWLGLMNFQFPLG